MNRLKVFSISILTFVTSFAYCIYLFWSRESSLWWSKISDVEKLISFRTEQALYYSYFKEFSEQRNVFQGLYVLYNNNLTEYPHKINVIKRMNVWQEIVLGSAYVSLKRLGVRIDPIEFYVNSVLFLQGILIASVFLLSLSINNSVLTSLLTISFFALNRTMVSRVVHSVPLRESFALPFWWLHILTFHMLIKFNRKYFYFKSVISTLFYGSTFLFILFWQFSQFMILLECCVIFVLDRLEFISHSLTRRYYLASLIAILVTCVLQMGNMVVLSSLPVTLLISSLLLDYVKSPRMMQASFSGRLTWFSIQATARAVLTIFLKILFDIILQQSDDSHIFEFLIAKFGIGRSSDFHVNLYLCHDGFKWLSIDQFMDSMQMVNVPFLAAYVIIGVLVFLSSIKILWHDTEEEEDFSLVMPIDVGVSAEGDFCGGCGHLLSNNPELVYHFGVVSASLCLTLTVQRMQYFLVPYMLILASMVFGNSWFYCSLVRPVSALMGLIFVEVGDPSSVIEEDDDGEGKVSVSRTKSIICTILVYARQVIVAGVLCKAALEAFQDLRSEFNDLREFYDPDTVALMSWIKHSTLWNESFSGSMQLMAAVKLVGGRPITNHPHYENQALRSRTKLLYQMYARREPHYVHNILVMYKVSYMILEDSICLAPSNGCQLTDLLDLDQGLWSQPKHVGTTTPRFCDAIRHLRSSRNIFRKYFQEVFTNPTFRVYLVL